MDRVWADLRRALPELEGAGIVDFTLTRGGTFTWFHPGWRAGSLPVEPGVAGLLLAGDHVRIPEQCQFMERAVTSGRHAANVVLERAGLPLVPILPPLR